MAAVSIHSMADRPDWTRAVARWWHAQWGEAMGYTPEGGIAAIESLNAPEGRQAALVALVDDVPAGSVFLTDRDLQTHRHLRPWLAGLYVLPEFRGQGVGEALMAAALDRAAYFGYDATYLYTAAPDYYRKRNWQTLETVLIGEEPHAIMQFRLEEPAR
ncbi:N-acetyltransferase [Youhaiella tibetensis]|nr:GNAT family N-acetyltransferase [Youhaiella tibetensis]AKR57426.1 GnaT-family acetyltransferase [Devosia sp. H5989]GGF42963.1 N-acetyltransferase [Youhaiella tibetensis]